MTQELLQTRAKSLRTHQTDAESRLWYHLRGKRLNGFKFKRQVVFGGNYIADFVCLTKRLIVEIDGGQHSQQTQYDSERTCYLESLGFKVLRFWNSEVLAQTESVLEVIWNELNKN